MNNGNHLMRALIQEQLDAMCESQHELENFHKRTIDRVDAMLLNKNALDLHPVVLDHLNAIKKLADS